MPEFSMNAVELEHTKTGAKHLHLERDDPNNVFKLVICTIFCYTSLRVLNKI